MYKNQKLRNVFIYKKPDILQTARQFTLRFDTQKARHFTLHDFGEIFEVGILIQKAWHFVLCDVFIYTNPETSKKARQFALRFDTKVWTLCFMPFLIKFYKFKEGGGILYAKNNSLCVTSFIQKALHYTLHFYTQKKMHFALRFYI